jgi:hypothetical protein
VTGFRYRDDRDVHYKTSKECGWTYGREIDGTVLLQLETYASDGSTDQVLQIDRKIAEDLLVIMWRVFAEGSDGVSA